MIHDYIIIGGGIAGLYAAYNIKKIYPDRTFLILEQNGKKLIGGRLLETMFEHNLVKTGAGVGRKLKDKYLINLCNELEIPFKEFTTKTSYAFDPIDIKQIFLNLKSIYDANPIKKTFKEFALPILGEEIYKNFIITSGFSDYENTDIEAFLYYYNFDDNYNEWIGLAIPWNKLIKKLTDLVGAKNIICNCKVKKIDDKFIHTTKLNYEYNKIIMATTIESIRLLLKNPIYDFIERQSFSRVYVKIDKKYVELMKTLVKGMTIVNNALQKIYSIDANKGIYSIAYADNKNADKLFQKRNDKKYISNLVKSAFKLDDFKINKVECFYRKTGTHYYKPLPTSILEYIAAVQHPQENIFVIGEVVAENQGWSDSALKSFHKIFNLI